MKVYFLAFLDSVGVELKLATVSVRSWSHHLTKYMYILFLEALMALLILGFCIDPTCSIEIS